MTAPVSIEFFTTLGCNRCAAAKTTLLDLISELGQENFFYREVDIVEEVDHAVELGVLSSSSIAINGELIFAAMPSISKLRTALETSMLARKLVKNE